MDDKFECHGANLPIFGDRIKPYLKEHGLGGLGTPARPAEITNTLISFLAWIWK